MLVTVSDKKIGHDGGNGTIDYYNADIITANDYYPFGQIMPGRKYSQASTKYRYGFNGKENDNEVKGEGNEQDYGLRIYDTRLGRFLSVDPLTKSYPHYTPYSYAGNKPTKFIDLDGAEETKNWGDYSFGDLMNWFSKPTNPLTNSLLKDQGFAHSLGSSFNRNLDPIYYSWIIATGNDPASAEYGKMNRADAAFGLTTMVVLHKSLGVAGKPTAAAALEKQLVRADVGMGSNAVSRTILKDESTVASSGGVTLKDASSQNGWGYNTTIANGKISAQTVKGGVNTTGRYDFVITNEGELVIGRGHTALSQGAETVQAAGELKIVNGKVREITNSSGHYKPTVAQGQKSVELLEKAGVNTSGTKVSLYTENGSLEKTYVKPK